MPASWLVLWGEFGEALLAAIRPIPHPDDVHKRDLWPTNVRARQKGETDGESV